MKRLLVFFILLASVMTSFSQESWARYSFYEKANVIQKSKPTKPAAIFMGNSITKIWYDRDSVFFNSNNFICRGVGGQVTSQMLTRFQSDVIDLKPQAVVILAGINDIAQNQGYISVQHIFENIVSMVTLAKANKIKVVLCTLVACDRITNRDDIDPKPLVAELNKKITEYAKVNKIKLADIYNVTADENRGMKDELRQPDKDGIHPGMAGYKVMETEVLKALASMKLKK